MATALKLYTADGNLNAITKTISNVNPEASDYTLKDFSVKLMTLSNNDLHKVERVDTKNITTATASTETAIMPITINSTTDYFSNDPTTYQTAFNALDGEGVTIKLTTRGYTTYSSFIDLGRGKNYSKWSEFAKYISSTLNNVLHTTKEFIQVAEFEGRDSQAIFYNFGADIIEIQLVQITSKSTYINNVWTNIIQPSESAPYTITFETEGNNTLIKIQRKE